MSLMNLQVVESDLRPSLTKRDPVFDVAGLTFDSFGDARATLDRLSQEEVGKRILRLEESAVKFGGYATNWDHFAAAVLFSDQPRTEKELLILAGTASAHGLLFLSQRDDVPVNVKMMSAVNQIERHLLGRRQLAEPFNDPELPAWILRLATQAEDLHTYSPSNMRAGLLENLNLPPVARAHLTDMDRWFSSTYRWCEYGTDQLSEHIYAQLEEEFPELVGLPAKLIIPILATQPFDTQWGVTPEHLLPVEKYLVGLMDELREKKEAEVGQR